MIPALYMRVVSQVNFLPFIARNPWPASHIGNAVIVTDVIAVCKPVIKNAVKPRYLITKAPFGIYGFVRIEMQIMMRLA